MSPWQRIAAVLAGLLLGLALGLFIFGRSTNDANLPILGGDSADAPPPLPTDLGGFPPDFFEAGEFPGSRTLGVMIDAEKTARQNWRGLEKAQLVVRAPAEGGIPRLLAIFGAADLPPEIGPVRSVRPYFLPFAARFADVLVHAGGSPQALEQLQSVPFKTVWAEAEEPKAFFRNDKMTAPHDLFLRPMSLSALRSSKNPERAAGLTFSEQAADDPIFSPNMWISAGPSAYHASWEFNPNKGCHLRRSMADAAHAAKSADGEIPPKESHICVENVLVMVANSAPIAGDAEYRLEVDIADARGTALLLRDGGLWRGNWEIRPGFPLQLTGSAGEPLPLAPGQVWISVVATADEVSF